MKFPLVVGGQLLPQARLAAAQLATCAAPRQPVRSAASEATLAVPRVPLRVQSRSTATQWPDPAEYCCCRCHRRCYYVLHPVRQPLLPWKSMPLHRPILVRVSRRHLLPPVRMLQLASWVGSKAQNLAGNKLLPGQRLRSASSYGSKREYPLGDERGPQERQGRAAIVAARLWTRHARAPLHPAIDHS